MHEFVKLYGDVGNENVMEHKFDICQTEGKFKKILNYLSEVKDGYWLRERNVIDNETFGKDVFAKWTFAKKKK